MRLKFAVTLVAALVGAGTLTTAASASRGGQPDSWSAEQLASAHRPLSRTGAPVCDCLAADCRDVGGELHGNANPRTLP